MSKEENSSLLPALFYFPSLKRRQDTHRGVPCPPEAGLAAWPWREGESLITDNEGEDAKSGKIGIPDEQGGIPHASSIILFIGTGSPIAGAAREQNAIKNTNYLFLFELYAHTSQFSPKRDQSTIIFFF